VIYDSNATQGGKYGTTLQAASKIGEIEIVQLLLEKGANPNIEGENVIQLKYYMSQMQLKVVNMELPFKQHHIVTILRLCSYYLKRVQTQMLKVRMTFNSIDI
jgi:ankyrin repeat protein